MIATGTPSGETSATGTPANTSAVAAHPSVPLQVMIITGISGSGKSLAIRVLEDLGYFCIDNLPVRFLRDVTRSLMKDGRTRIAISVDARAGTSLAGLKEVTEEFRSQGISVKTVFLNARTGALVRRYSETRRRHPLSVSAMPYRATSDGIVRAGPTLEESIERERELMADVEHLGVTLDTSDLHPNVLRQWIRDLAEAQAPDLTLLFESFAFKHGIPLDADLVFDVRCLPNPYYDLALRPLTGLDAPVQAFLCDAPTARKMIDDIERFLRDWIPSYRREHRHYLTVAIGCTGGQHRSVFVAQTLASRFEPSEYVLVRHRGLDGRAQGAGLPTGQTP